MTPRCASRIVVAIVAVGLLAACGSSPSASPSPTPTAVAMTKFSLLEVPYTISIPTKYAAAVRATPVTGSWIDELAPIAATQLNYAAARGGEYFLGNVFWFDAVQLAKITKPSEPPPGITMATLGDRVLVVAATVEMPFDPASADAKAYGMLSEYLRAAKSYSKFDCPPIGGRLSRPVTPAVLDVVTALFQGKELLPITVEGNVESVLDPQEQLAGTHSCLNADGGEGGYVGAVPAGATDAVMVYVHHKRYPVTQAESTFVTLAKVAGAWSVVGEGTGP